MREQPLHAAVRHLRNLVAVSQEADASDQELLRRFADEHDEAAFAALVRRHGPMVREVSRRLLGQESDVEDVLQAVFLVLACKSRSVRKRRSLAGWLYGIAYRAALRVRRDAARRKRRESGAASRRASDPAVEAARREVCEILDTELHRLPEGQRAAVVLCYLEGRTRDEAARQLGQSVRTLDRRLQSGRELLRRRLARRGVTLSASLLALGLTQNIAGACVPASLGAITAQVAAGIITGQKMAGHEISAEVLALMKGVLTSMLRTRIKIVAASVLALTLLGTATGVLAFRAAAQNAPTSSRQSSSAASPRPGEAAPPQAASEPDVYALLLIEDREPRLLSDERNLVPANGGEPAVYRRTQAVLLKSRSILGAALKRQEVARLAVLKGKADPEHWLARNIETTFLDNTGVLRVSLGEGSPEERATLINAVVTAYMDDVVYSEQRRKEARLASIDKALHSGEENLRIKRDALHLLSRKQRLASPSLTRQSNKEDLAQFRKELLRVRLAKVEAQARLNHRKSAARGGFKEPVIKLEEEIAVFAEQEKLLQRDISLLRLQAERIADDEAAGPEGLESLRDAIASEEQLNKRIAGQVETCRLELQAGSRVRILQKAEAPRKGK